MRRGHEGCACLRWALISSSSSHMSSKRSPTGSVCAVICMSPNGDSTEWMRNSRMSPALNSPSCRGSLPCAFRLSFMIQLTLKGGTTYPAAAWGKCSGSQSSHSAYISKQSLPRQCPSGMHTAGSAMRPTRNVPDILHGQLAQQVSKAKRSRLATAPAPRAQAAKAAGCAGRSAPSS